MDPSSGTVRTPRSATETTHLPPPVSSPASALNDHQLPIAPVTMIDIPSSWVLATQDEAVPSAGAADGIAGAVHHWLCQPPEVLFDAEVYGWFGQILGEHGTLELGGSAPTFFPPTASPATDEGTSFPCLSLDSQAQLPGTVQAIALAIGVPSPQCDGRSLATYFSMGWEVVRNCLPVVHEPTFDINVAPPVFLLSIIVCGAAFSSNILDRAVAQRLQPIVRALAAAVRNLPRVA